MLYLWCVQEVAGLEEEDLSPRTTGSAAVSSVDLSDIPDGTLGEWLRKHTIITSVIIMITSYDNDNYHIHVPIVMITSYDNYSC